MNSTISNMADPLVAECIRRVSARHSVAAVVCLPAGNKAGLGNVVLGIITVDAGGANRARFRLSGRLVDAFLTPRSRIVEDLHTQRNVALNRVYAQAHYVYGDRAVAEEAIRVASAAEKGGRLGVPAQEQFRHTCQPFDLLRAFHATRTSDVSAAGLLVHNLVAVCIEVYCAAHNLPLKAPHEMLNIIGAHDARVAQALRRVIESSPAALSAAGNVVDSLVERCVGYECADQESWDLDRMTKTLSSRVRVEADHIEQHHVAKAIRTYRGPAHPHDTQSAYA